LRAAYMTIVPELYRARVEQFTELFLNLETRPQADGGGSGDGSSGSEDGTGDADPGSSSADSTGPSSADPGATAADPGDPDPDPSVTADNAVTDPTAVNVTILGVLDFAAQQALDAVTTPWGGVPNPVPGSPVGPEPGNPGGPGPGGSNSPAARDRFRLRLRARMWPLTR